MLNGKKTERVMLRISEEMAQRIRALAEVEHRQVQDQVRFLIAVGLSHSRLAAGNATTGQRSQQPSADLFAEEMAKPQPSAAVSGRQPKREVA
jgi:hypothetical protein